MDPTLQSLLQSNLEWIFVGGKGGVGKTTTSSALATIFANTPISVEGLTVTRPRRVLLISTDPAHNLSDAFNQKIGKEPTVIKGTAIPETLYAMEIDPRQMLSGSGSLASIFGVTPGGSSQASNEEGGGSSPFSAIGQILQSAASSLPGIDELSVFTEILANVQALNFDLVIFDTAPTGHTLKMLALPQTLNTTIDRILQLEGLSPILEAAGTMLNTVVRAQPEAGSGSGGGASAAAASPSASGPLATDTVKTTVKLWREKLKRVQEQFNDSEKTCFVCVCIPEFLSVYETERLIQELMRYNISCDSIVVNQLVLKPSSEPSCRMCEARKVVQQKYLDQIDDLYEDFHVVKMPLMSSEVRGVAALAQFGKYLITPYDADRDGYIEVDSC